MNPKISEQQQSKPAYIYVRQSTLAQVRHHQESTERQYALRKKALELGWSETSIRILDRDLGVSGAHTTGRADFNDGLLLGLKGTMAQAELHFLRARLLGGKLNKAQKGELRFPLPVGFCHDDQDRIVVDPDDEVRGPVKLMFRLFQ